MTRATEIRAINCTSCGAGLDLLGGGRVMSHICSYCGAELDATENYRVLRKFTDLKRPESPLAIGMTGDINGVAFTVIGTLGMTERYQGIEYRWVEHQVFSPTHGYAWLTWEDGHLILTRKTRTATGAGWITVNRVETAENPPGLYVSGVHVRYYETTEAKITFAEGEFNWRPGVGDGATVISLLADQAMLELSETGTEREYELSTYLPQAETLASFGASPQTRPARRHPLQPLRGFGDEKFVMTLFAALAVICLILAGLFGLDKGRPVAPEKTIAITDLPAEFSFDLSRTDMLALIRLGADVSNSWAWIDATLIGPDDQVVFETGREVDYYHGRDSEGAWSEGKRHATLRFHPPSTGTYTLEIDVSESDTWGGGGHRALSSVSILVSEGAPSGFWFLIAALGFIVAAGLYYVPRLVSMNARWRGSDWSDD